MTESETPSRPTSEERRSRLNLLGGKLHSIMFHKSPRKISTASTESPGDKSSRLSKLFDYVSNHKK